MILALLALGVVSTAQAEWTKVGQTSQATVFVDKQSLRRSGSMSKVWTLTNFATPDVTDRKTSQSAKSHFEFDCKEERSRVLAVYMYALPNGTGNVNDAVSSVDPWYPLPPKSMNQRLWKIACGVP